MTHILFTLLRWKWSDKAMRKWLALKKDVVIRNAEGNTQNEIA